MKSFLFYCIFVFLLLGNLSADEVLMKNGDSLTGHIENIDMDTVVIKTAYGILRLSRQEINKATLLGTSSPPLTKKTNAAPSSDISNISPAEKWTTVMNESFSSSSVKNNWKDISREYGDGIMRRTENGTLRLTRGKKHYGWAEARLNLHGRGFEINFITSGVSNSDPYDRGCLYLLNNKRQAVFAVDPDNYKDKITVYAYEYDRNGKGSSRVICEAPYPENDFQHSFVLKRDKSSFSLFVDGKKRCSGFYTGSSHFVPVEYIRISGRGSNKGSGLDYHKISVKELK